MTSKGWGKRIRDARGEERQDAMARKMEMATSTWSEYEREIRPPTLETLIRFAKETGVSLDWIATGIPTEGVLDMEKLRLAVRAALGLAESLPEMLPDQKLDLLTKTVIGFYDDLVKEELDKRSRSANVPRSNM